MTRDCKPKCEGPRDDLFAAKPPLEVKKALFAMVAGQRGRWRRKGVSEVKLMFVDVNVKNAHLNAKCDEQVWVELPSESWKWGSYARLRRLLIWHAEGSIRMGEGLHGEVDRGGLYQRSWYPYSFLQFGNRGQSSHALG